MMRAHDTPRYADEEMNMDQKKETKRLLDDQGVLAVSVESATQAAEKTLLACFGIVRDVRGEVSQRALGVVDWVEATQQGLTRLARSVVQRTDEVATAWIDANEQLALGVVRALRSTGHGATFFASRTAASLTSTRQEIVAQA
jgi:hypothetical protein